VDLQSHAPPVPLEQGRKARRTARRLAEAAGERTGFVVIESAEPELKLYLSIGRPCLSGGLYPCQSASSIRTMVTDSQVRCEYRVSVRIAGAADVLVAALGTNDVTSQRKPSQFI